MICLLFIMQKGFLWNSPPKWNYSHSYKSQMSTLGLWYFCHRLFQHLLISQSEETSGAEDMPVLWKFLPKIARAKQIARPTEVVTEQVSGLCTAEQLSPMVCISSVFKSFFGPTADFLLCQILLLCFLKSDSYILPQWASLEGSFKMVTQLSAVVWECSSVPLLSTSIRHIQWRP